MPNVNDLRRFLKADMVQNGDLVHFCDAGTITNKEFNQDGKKKSQDMLEMDVMIGDTMKKITYSPNVTSRDLLKSAWGPNTESWVGETGVVSIIDQLSFGKLVPILIIKPVTNLEKWNKMQVQMERMKSTAQPQAAPSPGTPPDAAWSGDRTA